MSKTKLGEASYIKTNAYFSTFASDLFFHNDRTYTGLLVDSVYDDHSIGGFVEMGTELIPMNTLKGVIHYRQDVHEEWDLDYDNRLPVYGQTPDGNQQGGDVVVCRREHIPCDALPGFRRRHQLRHERGHARRFR